MIEMNGETYDVAEIDHFISTLKSHLQDPQSVHFSSSDKVPALPTTFHVQYLVIALLSLVKHYASLYHFAHTSKWLESLKSILEVRDNVISAGYKLWEGMEDNWLKISIPLDFHDRI